MRFTAWMDIGGFPEYAITEDLFTSWHLHGRGWRTLLVHEVLQWGLQPDCFVVHMKQRRRWVSNSDADVINMWLIRLDLVDRPSFTRHHYQPVFI